jgi:hypothetical protein
MRKRAISTNTRALCADNNWVKIGDQLYFVNLVDGRLMSTKKGQPPPDLFKRMAAALKPGGWLLTEEFDALSLQPNPALSPAEKPINRLPPCRL